MSLKSKIEAVIYASEEPVTLLQLVGLLGVEAEAELRALDAMQTQLPLSGAGGDFQSKDIHGSDFPGHANDTADTFADLNATALPNDSTAAESAKDEDEAAPQPVLSHVAVAGATPPYTNNTDFESSAVAETPHTTNQASDARAARERERQVRDHLRRTIDALMREYAESDRGIEMREVAGGFRVGTKPEYHDAVRGFIKSLKPALKLTLQALETLAVVAYKQPVTAAEISEIRGVDSAGVMGGLIGRKLIATAGRKQVIGRPMLYKTTKEFLVRFGLKDVQELPSMEEFERLAGELDEQEDLPMEATDAIIERANERGDADHIREITDDDATEASDSEAAEQPEGRTPQPVADDNTTEAQKPRW